MYYDELNECWCRSGKVVGDDSRTFGRRGNEHAKAAMLKTTADLTSFYTSHPDQSLTDSQNCRGTFQHLKMYCALGFNPKQNASLKLVGDRSPFVWGSHWMDKLKNSFPRETPNSKKLHMIGYMAEICYDLALSRGIQMSLSLLDSKIFSVLWEKHKL